MADVEGGNGDDDEKGTIKLSKNWLVVVFGILGLLPGVAVGVNGVLQRGDCPGELAICIDWCTTTFADDTRVFQSQFAGERGCKADCASSNLDCLARGDSQIIASIVLSSGLVCASVTYISLESIVTKFTNALPLESCKPRPLYVEPSFTEEERRKASPPLWRRWRREEVPTVFGHCLDCDIDVEVERRWLTVERGGMEGAVCPRCRKVILGVL